MTIDPAFWWHLKELAERASGWPMDTLHVIGGVVVQLVLAALLRTSLASRWPWLILFGLELANEAYDLWLERWPSFTMQLGEGARDVLGTMLLPTILWWVARRRPQLLAGRRK